MGRGSREADIMVIAEAPGGGRPSGDSVCRALRGDLRQAFAGLRADQRGDLHYQHFKMSSARQQGPQRGGKRSVFSVSEIRDISVKAENHRLSRACCGAANDRTGF